jgi:hypothetical protein
MQIRKKDQTSKVFLKVWFLTHDLTKILTALDKIGQELWEGLVDKIPAPYACQGIKVESLGWLYGSTNASDSKLFIKNVQKTVEDPPQSGHQCTMANDERRNEEEPPVVAGRSTTTSSPL